jgi:hypothetical protein
LTFRFHWPFPHRSTLLPFSIIPPIGIFPGSTLVSLLFTEAISCFLASMRATAMKGKDTGSLPIADLRVSQ